MCYVQKKILKNLSAFNTDGKNLTIDPFRDVY